MLDVTQAMPRVLAGISLQPASDFGGKALT